MTDLAHDERAVSVLLKMIHAEDSWYRRKALQGLEHHTKLVKVQRTLQQVASTDPDEAIRQVASAILTRAGIPLKPKRKRGKRTTST